MDSDSMMSDSRVSKNVDLYIGEYKALNENNNRYTITELIAKFKASKVNVIILKGTKIYNNKPYIIYIVSKGKETGKLEKIYRNNKKIRIAKKNNKKNSYFEFSTWDIIRLNRGQITGSNMNMLNDNEKYSSFVVL